MHSLLPLILNFSALMFTGTIDCPGTIVPSGFSMARPHSISKKKQPQFSLDPVVSGDSASCIIPFSRAGNLIIIKAKADTTEGSFILDTGAPHLVINITYFRDYLATSDSQEDPGGITGHIASASPTRVQKLSFGPIKYFNVDADRINLGHIENSKERCKKINGTNMHGRWYWRRWRPFPTA